MMKEIEMLKFDRDNNEYFVETVNVGLPKNALHGYDTALEKAVQKLQYMKLTDKIAVLNLKKEKLENAEEIDNSAVYDILDEIDEINKGRALISENADYIIRDELIRMHACFITKSPYRAFEDIRKMFLIHSKTVRRVYSALADGDKAETEDVQSEVTEIKRAIAEYLENVFTAGDYHEEFSIKFSNNDIFDILCALDGKRAITGKRATAEQLSRTIPAIVLRRMKATD